MTHERIQNEELFSPTEKQYGPWSAYGNSKLAVILHMRSVQAKYSSLGVTAYSVHPGAVNTDMGRYSSSRFARFLSSAFGWAMKAPDTGASCTLWCATSPAALHSAGSYHSACAKVELNKVGQDDLLAEALWRKTETLLENQLHDPNNVIVTPAAGSGD